jgi:ferredoxin-like protein FixX
MPVKSLKNLCLEGLGVTDEKLCDAMFNPCIHEITVNLNYKNSQKALTMTCTRFNLHDYTIMSRMKKSQVKQVIILTRDLTPIKLLQSWCLLKAFHSSERHTVILSAVKSKIFTPELGITLIDLLDLANRKTQTLLRLYWQPWSLRGLLTPSAQTTLIQLICLRAEQQQIEAPCLSVFKKRFLDEWCPVCIYRWAEYEELHIRYHSCCKGRHPDRWCDQCNKMRNNLQWASIVHLLA